jgi:pilus assembly protein CpaB
VARPELPPSVQAVARAVGARRRLVAAGLIGIAVVSGLTALRPQPAPTRAIWVAAHDLGGSRQLTAADVRLARLPLAAVPGGALPVTTRVVGRLLAAPVRRGEPITDVRLLSPALVAAAAPAGSVAVPVRVADGPATVALVRTGEHVDVLAGDDVPRASGSDHSPTAASATTVASGLDVLSVGSTDDGSGLLVVIADRQQAAALAQAGVADWLSVAVDAQP